MACITGGRKANDIGLLPDDFVPLASKNGGSGRRGQQTNRAISY